MNVKDLISKMINRDEYSIVLQYAGIRILEADAESLFWEDSNSFTEAQVDTFELSSGGWICINIKGFKSIDVQENWTIPEDEEDLPEAWDVIGSDEI